MLFHSITHLKLPYSYRHVETTIPRKPSSCLSEVTRKLLLHNRRCSLIIHRRTPQAAQLGGVNHSIKTSSPVNSFGVVYLTKTSSEQKNIFSAEQVRTSRRLGGRYIWVRVGFYTACWLHLCNLARITFYTFSYDSNSMTVMSGLVWLFRVCFFLKFVTVMS